MFRIWFYTCRDREYSKNQTRGVLMYYTVYTQRMLFCCTVHSVLYNVQCTHFYAVEEGDAILVLEAKQASHVHSKIIL